MARSEMEGVDSLDILDNCLYLFPYRELSIDSCLFCLVCLVKGVER